MSRGSEWCEVASDEYFDKRHGNWVISEEMDDVVFVRERGVVLVHRVRAEHIARALGMYPEAPAPAPPPPARMRLTRASASAPPLAVEAKATSRWRGLCGWLVILAGAVVFVVALVVPLDDAALAMAVAMGLRGGRLVLDVDS